MATYDLLNKHLLLKINTLYRYAQERRDSRSLASRDILENLRQECHHRGFSSCLAYAEAELTARQGIPGAYWIGYRTTLKSVIREARFLEKHL